MYLVAVARSLGEDEDYVIATDKMGSDILAAYPIAYMNVPVAEDAGDLYAKGHGLQPIEIVVNTMEEYALWLSTPTELKELDV